MKLDNVTMRPVCPTKSKYCHARPSLDPCSIKFPMSDNQWLLSVSTGPGSRPHPTGSYATAGVPGGEKMVT